MKGAEPTLGKSAEPASPVRGEFCRRAVCRFCGFHVRHSLVCVGAPYDGGAHAERPGHEGNEPERHHGDLQKLRTAVYPDGQQKQLLRPSGWLSDKLTNLIVVKRLQTATDAVTIDMILLNTFDNC